MAHLRMKLAPRRGRSKIIASTRQSLRALWASTRTTEAFSSSQASPSSVSKRRFHHAPTSSGVVLESVPSLVDQVMEGMEGADDDDISSTADSLCASRSEDDGCQLNNDDKRERLRRRPFRWIPAYICRNMPSLMDEAEEMSAVAADLPSDSFIGVAPFPSAQEEEEVDTASSTSSSKGDSEADEEWREVLVDEFPLERRVRFAPMVKKIQYQRYADTGAVWWTREDRRRTIEEASNEINVYIRQFPETFRTIVLLCQNEMKDYTTLKQIMPVRGLLRPCLNRLSRDDALVRTWVQKARKSVSYIVRLQATDIAIAHYTSYSMAASRMALYVAQADARAVTEDNTIEFVDPSLLTRSASSETLVGPSERITV